MLGPRRYTHEAFYGDSHRRTPMLMSVERRERCTPFQTPRANPVYVVGSTPTKPSMVGESHPTRREDSPYEVLNYLKPKLDQVRRLPHNWDGQGGVPATTDAALQMYQILKRISDRRTVFPFISPDNEGGILAEWHARHQKIEIEVDAQGEAFLHATDKDGSTVISDEWTPELEAKLQRLLVDLSVRTQQQNPNWRQLFLR